MRIFKNVYDAVEETRRDLLVRGKTVDCNSYQDKLLVGEDRKVKELTGVSFIITNPLAKRFEALEDTFKQDAKRIEEYCIQEAKDRTSGTPMNPGNSCKIRQDMWMKFQKDGKFAYTYSERLWRDFGDNQGQFKTVLDALRKDAGSRQAIVMLWHPDIDCKQDRLGGGQRVSCSISYQFMIRDGKLHCIYYMRSCSALEHFPIDLFAASEIMKWVTEQLQDTYPGLKVGDLHYMAGSLHAFNWNLKDWVVY